MHGVAFPPTPISDISLRWSRPGTYYTNSANCIPCQLFSDTNEYSEVLPIN